MNLKQSSVRMVLAPVCIALAAPDTKKNAARQPLQKNTAYKQEIEEPETR